uniref:hypothetical protein n=1 Tax=Amycolatopsis sp. CA-290885 TaxID=3239925 RepID=UPI003F491214
MTDEREPDPMFDPIVNAANSYEKFKRDLWDLGVRDAEPEPGTDDPEPEPGR